MCAESGRNGLDVLSGWTCGRGGVTKGIVDGCTIVGAIGVCVAFNEESGPRPSPGTKRLLLAPQDHTFRGRTHRTTGPDSGCNHETLVVPLKEQMVGSGGFEVCEQTASQLHKMQRPKDLPKFLAGSRDKRAYLIQYRGDIGQRYAVDVFFCALPFLRPLYLRGLANTSQLTAIRVLRRRSDTCVCTLQLVSNDYHLTTDHWLARRIYR